MVLHERAALSANRASDSERLDFDSLEGSEMRIAIVGLILALVVGAIWLWSRASLPTQAVAGEARAATAQPAGAREELARPAASDESLRAAAVASGDSKTPATTHDDATHETGIRGRVIDEHGAPLANAAIGIGDAATQSSSGADGRFRILVAMRGETTERELFVDVVAASRVALQIATTVRRGETIDLGDLALVLGGRIEGRVLDEHGVAVGGAHIAAVRESDVDFGDLERSATRGAMLATTGAANGAFVLDGVPAARARVIASSEGFAFTASDAIEVRAGDATRDLVLALRRLSTDGFFEIVVQKPDGSPCAKADIHYGYRGVSKMGQGILHTNDDGRTRLVPEVAVAYDFDAQDHERLLGVATAHGVRLGSGPVVLRLTEARKIALEVVDERGAPVANFQVRRALVSPDSSASFGSFAPSDEFSDGRAEFAVPPSTFAIHISSEKYRDLELGPFEPESAPSSLRATLQAIAFLSGRVLHDGAPIANSTVSVGQALSANLRYSIAGFTSSQCFDELPSTQSDEHGAFALRIERAGDYWLRAERAGFAVALIGPITIDPSVGKSDVELALSTGGAIEGRLLTPAGENPIGAIIGASCGDGLPRTERVDANGGFRFEHLASGRWFVKRVPAVIDRDRGARSFSTTDKPVEIPWNCIVVDGETTRLDLDQRVDARPRVLGRLTFDGKPAVGWSVRPSLDESNGGESTGGQTNGEGRFEVRPAAIGHGALGFASPSGSSGELYISVKTEFLAGDNAWERDFATGSITFSLDAAAEPGERVLWLNASGIDASLKVSGHLVMSDPSAKVFSNVPIGHWALRVERVDSKVDLPSLDLNAGDTAKVSVP